MKILNAKGTKDFLPEEKILRQKIVDQLREIFELYGYSPLETPCLERMDVLAAKYAGGAEILKETFQLRDQGDRQLGLKYDLTVPFCRVIAMNPQLRMPFKRYQIEKVFRDGPIKLGRLREFWQCDVDVAGCKSMVVDAEMVAIASAFFKKVGLKVVIRVNNRKVLDAMMEDAGIEENKRESAILTLDKLEKIGEAGVKKEFEEKCIDGDKLLNLIKQKTLSLKDDEGLNELKELEEFLKLFGVTNYKIDYTLARGLAYYTGTVFEVQCKELDSSVAGGGRYDKMIGGFLGKGEVPAVGISFGLEPIYEILKNKEKVRSTVTQVYVVPIKCFNESLNIVKELRGFGVKCDIDLKGKSISKNLDYVNKMGIPYALIVGENELKAGKFSLKDMEKGSEENLGIPGIVKRVKGKVVVNQIFEVSENKMKRVPTKGRLHTADHILCPFLEKKYKATTRAMQFKEGSCRIDFVCSEDLSAKKQEMEKAVNDVVAKGLEVKYYELSRDEAVKITDLSLIPKTIKNVGIYEIVGLNKVACAGPHVDNTSDIGKFVVLEIKKKGKDTYSVKYTIE